MGDALLIDTAGVRGVAEGLARTIGEIADIERGAAVDAAAGALSDDFRGLSSVLSEVVDELGLTARLLIALASQSLSSDVFTTWKVDAYPGPTGHFGFLPIFGPDGPSAADIVQGKIGNCAVMAGWAGLAAMRPDLIRSLITDHGDGTYTVHFVDGDIRVDDEFGFRDGQTGERFLYAGGPITPATPLWPAIVEKALAVRADDDYDELSGDNAADAWSSVGATTETIGWRGPIADSPGAVAAKAGDALADGYAVAVVSFGAFGFGGGHGWTVLAVEGAGDDALVTIRNPWGQLGFSEIDGELVNTFGDRMEFAREEDAALITVDDPSDPVITIPATVFAANFKILETVRSWPANLADRTERDDERDERDDGDESGEPAGQRLPVAS